MKGLRDQLASQGVHSLLVQFTDLEGVARGKLVPLAHLDDVLTTGAAFSGGSIQGMGLARTGPASVYHARGIASTAQALPWLPGVARIVGEGFVGGQPHDACPRQALARQAARLAQQHPAMSLHVGVGIEFYLLRRDGTRGRPADERDRSDWPSHDVDCLVRQVPLLQALQEALEHNGLDVLQLAHAAGHGQYEIGLAHTDALACADRLMLFRLAARAVAEAHDRVFSLHAKPLDSEPGSGMRCHVSLWHGQRENARNLFVAHRADGSLDPAQPLSPLGRHFMAGVLAHAGALCALAAPTVESYRRLGIDAPGCVAYGFNNDSALVRTQGGRFKWCAPDAGANPYLVFAGLVAAGLDGVERKLDPGPDCSDDLFGLGRDAMPARGLQPLPATLGEALDALEADPVVLGALGDTLAREFVQRKRQDAAATPRSAGGESLPAATAAASS
jgi:glutamine synthetase